MNKRLSVLIWAGAGIAIPVALFALFVKDDILLTLFIIFCLVAYVLFLYVSVLFFYISVLFLYVLGFLVKKVPAWMERPLGIISTLVDNGVVTFLLAALMLGLIWQKWTIKKEQGEVARTIALRILDNLDGTRQQELSNLQQTGPNAQRRIKKAIREELRRRSADEIALMFLDGSAEMQALIDEMLPKMPIKIRWDIKRAIKKEERHRKEARERPLGEEEPRWREAREIDQLFEGNIEKNTSKIVRRFFSGEFQDREYVIKKIRETSPEVQHRFAEKIKRKQNALLKKPQTFMPGNAFVYLIRQVNFATEQFSFKIGSAGDPGGRLRALQTGNPYLLHLWAVMSFPDTAAAEEKEKELHENCQAWQETGEWFHGDALEELLRDERFTPYFDLP